MDLVNEARAARSGPQGLQAGGECAKDPESPDITRIEYNSPENAVVLSRKLEQLARRVGGCQTDELLALLRRIMFEVIQQRKY